VGLVLTEAAISAARAHDTCQTQHSKAIITFATDALLPYKPRSTASYTCGLRYIHGRVLGGPRGHRLYLLGMPSMAG
jgi:hypothetical protein